MTVDLDMYAEINKANVSNSVSIDPKEVFEIELEVRKYMDQQTLYPDSKIDPETLEQLKYRFFELVVKPSLENEDYLGT